MNHKKTNKTRRQRGYAFENHIVKEFNDKSQWHSKRLGGASVYLPDVMCVNDFYKSIIAIEAKSTVQNYAYVPADQIERCKDWVNMLGVYHTKQVVLAFKFGRTITSKLQKRKLRYHFKVFPHKQFAAVDVRCDYDGMTLIKEGDTWVPLVMEELKNV